MVWHHLSSIGETPMKAQRYLDYTDNAAVDPALLDIEGVSHVVNDWRLMDEPFTHGEPAGVAFVHRNLTVLPRARLAGRPVYAEDRLSAIAALRRLGSEF